MKTEADARAARARADRASARRSAARVVCLMSDMEQPLGMAVGNALEVIEAVETLRGEGPEALTELCMAFGARMLVLGERAADEAEARALLAEAIASGRALERFREWVAAQGGDPRRRRRPLAAAALSAHAREVRATRGRLRRAVRCRGRRALGDAAWRRTRARRRRDRPGRRPGDGGARRRPRGRRRRAVHDVRRSRARCSTWARIASGTRCTCRAEPVVVPPLFHEL